MNTRTANIEDEKIIELLNGSELEMDEAVRYLYRNYYTYLTTYILSNSGNEQDADDIFQNVIIAFVNTVKANKFRGESSIKTFLFALNRNHWLNEIKRRERQSVREHSYGNLSSVPAPDAQENLENRQSKTELMQLLDRVGESCKKLLLLFYFENRSMKEIAGSLNYENEQVARSKKFKCLKKMEQLVRDNKTVYEQLKNFLHE